MEVARLITEKKCPQQFVKNRVLQINTMKLLELAEKSVLRYRYALNSLIEFAMANKEKIIFYFDNLLHIKCDIYMLKWFMKFMKLSNVKIIASSYPEDFESYFLTDRELMKYLNLILIEEPDVEEIYPMLKTRIQKMQEKYGVEISKSMIRFSILTGLYLSSSTSSNPENTLDIINFALSDAKRKKQKEVTKQNILAYYFIDFKLENKKARKNYNSISRSWALLSCKNVSKYKKS